MDECKKFSVYCHTNNSNNKKYFGITKQVVTRRWRSGKGYEYCKKFYNAIQKYGWDNFSHDVLYSNLTEKEALDIEMQLIKKQRELYGYDSCYNISDGGIGVRKHVSEEERRYRFEISKFKNPVYQIDLNGNIVKKWESIKQIKRETGWKSITEIVSCAKKNGNSNTSKGYVWIFEKDYNKDNLNLKEYSDRMLLQPIIQISNNNEIVMEYSDINDVINNNKDYKKSTIYSVLNSKDSKKSHAHRTAYKYVWVYKKEYDKNIDYSKYFNIRNEEKKNKVKMINIETKEIVMIFESITDASKYIGCQGSNITACCKGRQKTAKGYIFKYLN